MRDKRYWIGIQPNFLAAIVFGISAISWAVLIGYLESDRLRDYRNQAEGHAISHSHAIQREIENSLSAAYALAALVREGRGKVPEFDHVAGDLLNLYPGIFNLNLSPGGVISQIFPVAGNEKALGFNQLADPVQNKEAWFAHDSRKLSLAGPLNLVEGGLGLVGRYPVFLESESKASPPSFWGFTNVVIRFPDVLYRAGLLQIEDDGFAYELWRINPESTKKQVIASSTTDSLVEPVDSSISLPNGNWVLSVAPPRGWSDSAGLALKSFVALILSLLLAYVAKLHAKSKLHEMELEVAVEKRTSEILEREEQLRIAATAFDSHDGIMVTDAQKNIIKVNHAFTEITGYSESDAIGRTPAILKSGRHPDEFYQDMWESLNHDQCWQGEIWNHNKNGNLIAEWLRITAITDESGRVRNYVGAFSDITRTKESEEAIHNLSFYDALTGLPNRRLLLDRLRQVLLSSTRNDDRGAILFVDLDNFKYLNDTKGHETGDLLLIEVARRIRACVHTDDTIARLGSDEFVVVLDALDSDIALAVEKAELVAQRIHRSIKQPIDLNGYEYHCKACVGINMFRDHETTLEDLLKHADSAMLQAKQSGRDKVHFFDAGMQATLEMRVQLESWLRKALPEQLLLYYQMQTDCVGNIGSAEVLVRWLHPEKGLISPAEFIPMAEETGLILPIGRWVLETACLQLKKWESDLKASHLSLAVNVSAKQFLQDDFVEQVMEVLMQSGADPSKLKLELTESMLVDDVENIIHKMNELKAIGIRFSLDDFGTGFSSLNYLKRLPLNQLKIDQSFVRNLHKDASDAAIVRAVISLGHSLKMEVIAEGVETDAQLAFLIQYGCGAYQGYLFSKPVPLQEFESLLNQ